MITKPVEIITKRPWLSASIITFILLVSSCRFYERQHRKNYAPKGISVGQTLIYAPGCYIWACGGGSVFKLPKRTREKIEAGGLDYLNSLAGFGKNKRPIRKWEFYSRKWELYPRKWDLYLRYLFLQLQKKWAMKVTSEASQAIPEPSRLPLLGTIEIDYFAQRTVSSRSRGIKTEPHEITVSPTQDFALRT